MNTKYLSPQAFILILFLFFAAGQAQAQTDKEKELQKMEEEIASGKLSDEEVLQRYASLIANHFVTGFEKARDNCRKAVAFAHEKKNVGEEANFLTAAGDLYRVYKINDTALIFLDKALKILEGMQEYELETYHYRIRGNNYIDLNDFENAIDSFLKSMEANKKDKAQKIVNKQSIDFNIYDEVALLNQIGMIYDRMSNEDKTIEYLLKAKKIMDDNPSVDFRTNKPSILTNLAQKYMGKNQYEKALPLLEEVYKLTADKAKSGSGKEKQIFVTVLIAYTTYYDHEENTGKVLEYGKQALQIAEEINLQDQINKANMVLMRAYFDIKDYKTSIYYAERMDKETDWYRLGQAYLYLALNNAVMGNTKEVKKYVKKQQEIIEKKSDENLHKATQEMEVKYQTAEKQLEIEHQQAAIERQRYIIFAVIVIALLIIGFSAYIIKLRNRRARALAEMNAIKDKFFSIISHDLKNPVITQRNALELLTENADKWDANTVSEYYEKLLKQSDDLVDLLKNLLNWSLIQLGRNTHNPITFNLVAALQPDINVIKSMAERKNINFETPIPKIAIITADQNMLVTVVRNLLANAVKFTPTGGTITLAINEDNGKHTVSVTDTGVGMSAEHVRNLFRLESAHSQPGTAGEQGSALGLIVCKELLEKHGSALHVESTEGKGSRFWFEV